MNDCPHCGGELVAVGRLRLCRSCSSAFIAVAPPRDLWQATKSDIVQQVIEAWDRRASGSAAADGQGRES